MSLRRYHEKRDFAKTPEPEGDAPRGKGAGRYVIQKHAATRLHYDFRLELDGVLLSWAVPRGPSLNPADRRLAVHVEDHPVEYGSFEGIIPEGEYGGGAVVLWDRGRWYPEGDAAADYRKGHLRFRLAGEKLHGSFSLVRMHGRRDEKADNWLLIKADDAEATSDGEVLVRDRPESVKTGRTLEDIQAAPGKVWHSDRGAAKTAAKKTARTSTTKTATAAKKTARTSTTKTATAAKIPPKKPASKTAAKRVQAPRYGHDAQPETITPELATLVDEVPTGDDWLHEIKYDGYRLIARIDRGSVQLLTRKHEDWAPRFPWLVDALRAQIPGDAALIDGELVHLGNDGVTRFGALQQALSAGDHHALVYFAFDLLHLQGVDLRRAPLVQRKQALAALLAAGPALRRIRLSEHFVGNGERLFGRACKLGLEGVMAKRADSVYRSGRHRDWLKIKCSRRQEVVVGGFTTARSGPRQLGALLIGVHDDDGAFVYCGKVGTGFDFDLAGELRVRLDKLVIPRPAFTRTPPGYNRSRFVRPELVIDVQFTEWTSDGRLRHPVFVGIREDKRARDVRREQPAATPESAEESAVNQTTETTADKKTTKRRSASKTATAKKTSKKTAAKTTTAKKATAKKAAKKTPLERTPTPSTAEPTASAAESSEKSPRKMARPPARKSAARAAAVEVLGVSITHPDRELYPGEGITKLDIAEYHREIAEWILPHVAERPVSIVRCPDGIADGGPGRCFFQKHLPYDLPAGLFTTPLDEEHEPFLFIKDAQGLVALTQVGVLEIHAWGATVARPDDPDRIVFDLDPDAAVPWNTVKETAAAMRARLADLELESFLKTTGGKGLHVVVPLTRGKQTWDDVKAFARGIALEFTRAAPELFTANMSKAGRARKIYIDYLRNYRGSTSVANYSPRARPGAPVAVPLRWDELAALATAQKYTVHNLQRRLSTLRKDPWADFDKTRQSLRATLLREVTGKAA